MFNLGDFVKDKITGFSGVVMARTEYLTGCNRVSLQSKELKDGKPLEWQAFDEDQCELVPEAAQTDLDVKNPGGPQQCEPKRPSA